MSFLTTSKMKFLFKEPQTPNFHYLHQIIFSENQNSFNNLKKWNISIANLKTTQTNAHILNKIFSIVYTKKASKIKSTIENATPNLLCGTCFDVLNIIKNSKLLQVSKNISIITTGK